jgi:Flp pilus assembly protein TadD
MKMLLQRFARAFSGPALSEDAEPIAERTQLADAIRVAIDYHKAGRLNEAAALYRQMLAADPDHFDALQLLGVLSHQTGDTKRAVELLERSCTVRPDDPAAVLDLGAAYQAMHRLRDAERCFRSALAMKPNWDHAHNRLGIVLQACGELAASEACFRQALTCNPESAETLNNLGNVLKERGALEEAEVCYRRTVALRPDLAEGYYNLGSVLRQCSRLDEAEAAFIQALAARPRYAEALNNLGGVLRTQGRLLEAESQLLRALEFRPELPEISCNLGDVLQALGRPDEAEVYCRQALALRPAYPDALNNLAVVCKQLGRLDEAEGYCRQALAIDQRHARTCSILGTIANERGRFDEAEAYYRRALELTPTSAQFRYNLGMLRLLRGDYREGLALYESRFDSFAGEDYAGSIGLYKQLARCTRWHGEPLDGKRLLVWTEQGLGDSIMTMRFLPQLRQEGASKVIVHCESVLGRVMAAVQGVDQVTTEEDPPPIAEFDLHCPMMSLPLLHGTRLESIPQHVPYLTVPEPLGNHWRKRLAGIVDRKVGIAWAGSKSLRADAKRSIALRRFAPLLGIDGVQLISLQKGPAAIELNDCGWPVADWMAQCRDLMDTAALIANLDLVVTVDTVIAHLAGALGKPVWLLNRFGSEWRWGLERDHSPWYPTMQIFRQAEPNDWDSVIERVAADLSR